MIDDHMPPDLRWTNTFTHAWGDLVHGEHDIECTFEWADELYLIHGDEDPVVIAKREHEAMLREEAEEAARAHPVAGRPSAL
jgi:hypothetical protein